MVDVVVVGQVGRDIVLVVEEMPDAGGGTAVSERQELLGGAANQAVGARQMGWSAALVGVVGDDTAGDLVLGQARDDQLDVSGVVRRTGATTALFLDVVTMDGARRLFEDVPDDVLLTAEDVRSADVLGSARAVLVQLQQPPDAVREAVRTATAAGSLVALDGTADDDVLAEVLPSAALVRADAVEASAQFGALRDTADVLEAARELVGRGAGIAALSTGDADVVAWSGGHVTLPQLGEDPADVTGAGDAFVVGLVSALLRGEDRETAAWWAAAAAASAVGKVGGRPDLDAARVAELARRSRP